MASNDSGQEKTEDATPKRLREARKKGQVPKSKDVSTILVLIAVFFFLAMTVSWMGFQIKEYMIVSFNAVATGNFEGSQLWSLGKAGLFAMAKVILPFGLIAVVVAIFSGFIQFGAIFALDPLKPQLKKLNMIEGLKNMFKTQTFIELLKNIAKILVVFYLAYSTLKGELATVLRTAKLPVSETATITGELIFSFVVKVLVAFLIISVIDFIVQKRQFMKQMRMTKDEVKREYKQDEGDPTIKSHRKQLHKEYAFGDVKKQVAKSDAVVTNPSHVAVALSYNREEMVAPEITIKGQKAFAEIIKQAAVEFNIPIIRNVGLAWTLFEVEEGQEIPETLYETVAEILSYVYKMKQQGSKGHEIPV